LDSLTLIWAIEEVVALLYKAENVLVSVERLRQQAEGFQRTVEEELGTARALREEPHVREATRRGHAKRLD
jgi:predicted ATP-grasp superfamily ATP-dependent carboligase